MNLVDFRLFVILTVPFITPTLGFSSEGSRDPNPSKKSMQKEQKIAGKSTLSQEAINSYTDENFVDSSLTLVNPQGLNLRIGDENLSSYQKAVLYEKVKDGTYVSLTDSGTHLCEGGARKDLLSMTVSPTDFAREAKSLEKWQAAKKLSISSTQENPVENKAAHFIHFLDKANTFVFTNATKKHPILYTSHVCDCVVAIGYNSRSKAGFLAHLSHNYEGSLMKDFRASIKKIRGGDELGDIHLSLITRQASNFSEKVLGIVQKMNIQNLSVNAYPNLISKIEHREGVYGYKVRQYFNPSESSFLDFYNQTRGPGRTILFDIRTGKISEYLE